MPAINGVSLPDQKLTQSPVFNRDGSIHASSKPEVKQEAQMGGGLLYGSSNMTSMNGGGASSSSAFPDEEPPMDPNNPTAADEAAADAIAAQKKRVNKRPRLTHAALKNKKTGLWAIAKDSEKIKFHNKPGREYDDLQTIIDYFKVFSERCCPGIHIDDFIRQSENILTTRMLDPDDPKKRRKLEPLKDEVLNIRCYHKRPEQFPSNFLDEEIEPEEKDVEFEPDVRDEPEMDEFDMEVEIPEEPQENKEDEMAEKRRKEIEELMAKRAEAQAKAAAQKANAELTDEQRETARKNREHAMLMRQKRQQERAAAEAAASSLSAPQGAASSSSSTAVADPQASSAEAPPASSAPTELTEDEKRIAAENRAKFLALREQKRQEKLAKDGGAAL